MKKMSELRRKKAGGPGGDDHGKFNAHFDENRVGLDRRASLLTRLGTALNLTIMTWVTGAKGKCPSEEGDQS